MRWSASIWPPPRWCAPDIGRGPAGTLDGRADGGRHRGAVVAGAVLPPLLNSCASTPAIVSGPMTPPSLTARGLSSTSVAHLTLTELPRP